MVPQRTISLQTEDEQDDNLVSAFMYKLRAQHLPSLAASVVVLYMEEKKNSLISFLPSLFGS